MKSAGNKGSETQTAPKLKNGLTVEQVERAKEVLANVNVSELCRKNKINRATVENVLRDKSSRVADLNKLLRVAKPKAEKKENVLKDFAL